jgi:outer membrane protein assembly factor BamB
MIADLSESQYPIGFPPRVGCSFCPADGKIYIPYWNGDTYRLDPATRKMYWVANGLNGDIYGQAFNPKEPHIWYLSFIGDGADPWKHSIVAVNTQTWERTLVAGQGMLGHRDGNGDVARFASPRQIAFDADGNLYIADLENRCIRMIGRDGKVSTVIGQPGVQGHKDGSQEEALLTAPTGLAIDNEGTIYIADGSRLRKLAIE